MSSLLLFCVFYFFVSSNSGMMYWAEQNTQTNRSILMASSLDGSSPKILFSTNYTIQSLALDYKLQRIYYVIHSSGISFINLKTLVVTDILQTNDVMSISSLTLLNDNIYFTENIQGGILSCEKFTCVNYTSIKKSTRKILCSV